MCSRSPDAASSRGPVHVLDAGRYYAKIVEGVPMIFRADTAGAVLGIEASGQLVDELLAERKAEAEVESRSAAIAQWCYVTFFACMTTILLWKYATPWAAWGYGIAAFIVALILDFVRTVPK